MSMRLFTFLILIVVLFPFQLQAKRGGGQAAPSVSVADEDIVAVVNDAVISTADIRARMALAMMTSGFPDTPEVKKHILPQVLRSLIDEQLQIQEGKRLEISVTTDEINKAMNKLAQENRIPGGDMAAFLVARGVPPSAMAAQARAALTWNKVVQRELRPRVDIGDDEVDAVIERMRANEGKQEYLVSEIFLAVDSAKDEEQVRAFAEKLVQQIRSGTSFGAVARQFSQGAGAAAGGDIGWIQEGQLASELDKTLQTMGGGQIAGPVRSSNGFHILGVREKRTVSLGGGGAAATVSLQQAFRPFVQGERKAVLLNEANKLRKTVTGCSDLGPVVARGFPAWRWQDLGEVKLDSAPAWLADKVRNLEAGQSTEVMGTDKGALIIYVCGRKAAEKATAVNRDEIINSIGAERMELLARRLLRDLRRNAYIDVRMTL